MTVIGLVLMLMISGYAMEVVPTKHIPQVGLKIVRPVTLDYYLLSKGSLAEFKVIGVPDSGIWLRIYSRLWFNRDFRPKGKVNYVLTFIQQDSAQRFRLKTEVSNSTQGPAGQPVGKWRSFYVHLLPGVTQFQLFLDSALVDTVAVRFRPQPPRVWEQMKILNTGSITLIIKDESTEVPKTGYYKLKTGEPMLFSVSGPCRIRLRFRIDYDPSLSGSQTYIVEISENGNQIVNRTFRVTKDIAARYLEDSGVIPSKERVVVFELGEGEHRLSVMMKGVLAKTASMAIDRLPNEKYE